MAMTFSSEGEAMNADDWEARAVAALDDANHNGSRDELRLALVCAVLAVSRRLDDLSGHLDDLTTNVAGLDP
jgi:hypothetical protein